MKRKRNAIPSKPKMYYHIGHADPKDVIWAWIDGELVTYVAGNLTHETIWGKAIERRWRGRYEVATKRLSILSPAQSQGQNWQRIPPIALQDALESSFGTKDIYYFNPSR